MSGTKIYKVVLLGEGGVGKTSLRHTYLGQGFKKGYSMTIGADFAAKRAEVDGENITAQIWDLAGQERFESVRSVYYRGSVGGLLVFDITRPETFSILPSWITELIQNNNNKITPFVLIGNKGDLRGKTEVEVDPNDAETYAKALSDWSGYDVPYVETSALSGQNVDKAFVTLLRNVRDYLEQFRKQMNR